MRFTAYLLVTLAFCATASRAQEPSSPDNPAPAQAAPSTPAQPAPAQAAPAQAAPDQSAPTPDADGVYQAGPGIESPYLTSPAVATLPANADTSRSRIVRFTAVIAADGSVTKLNLLRSRGDAFETAATAAVQQSKFAPGTLNGKTIPVLVCMSVPFVRVLPAIPRLQDCPDPNAERSRGETYAMPPGVTPPRPIYQPSPEYSDEARKRRIQGVVLLSTRVNEQGQPTDIWVEQPLGYGLDQKAMEAVSQYRFRPATDPNGKPIAVRVAIEVSFRLY